MTYKPRTKHDCLYLKHNRYCVHRQHCRESNRYHELSCPYNNPNKCDFYNIKQAQLRLDKESVSQSPQTSNNAIPKPTTRKKMWPWDWRKPK